MFPKFQENGHNLGFLGLTNLSCNPCKLQLCVLLSLHYCVYYRPKFHGCPLGFVGLANLSWNPCIYGCVHFVVFAQYAPNLALLLCIMGWYAFSMVLQLLLFMEWNLSNTLRNYAKLGTFVVFSAQTYFRYDFERATMEETCMIYFSWSASDQSKSNLDIDII